MTPAAHFTQFGRYEIIRKLGRSMTDVYLALDPAKNRRVVLKIVEQCRDAYTDIIVEAERRGAAIQQELHALDPRILEVYEYGDLNGCFFVAMQYAEGRSLSELLRLEGRLDPIRAARYIAEVCGQLITLHAFQAEIDGHKRAVVHGDIKPSNIQIGPNGEARLLDFGIAKYITETRNLTSHNLGSPAYCSPERLLKAQVDPQADLWALGVCLYEAVCGAPPYQAQTTRKLENLIQSRRPPRALPDSCPVPLKAVIWKALAGDITRRYASAEEFHNDLQAYIHGQPTTAQKAGAGWEANATIERQKPHRVTRVSFRPNWLTLGRERYGGAAAALAAGVVVGILLFVPASYSYRFWVESEPLRNTRDYTGASVQDIERHWSLYSRLQNESKWFGELSPALRLKGPLRASLTRTGRDIVERYRTSSDPDISNFDWNKASHCFRRVLEIDPSDAETKGWLAISDGYAAMVRDANADQAAEASFRASESYLPKSPDPHLGLMRIYAYARHNPGQAAAQLTAAERLGFSPGPREYEQEADAYLFRAEQELETAQKDHTVAGRRKWLGIAGRDATRARNLYEPIAGFSRVSTHLERLDRNESLAEHLRQVSLKPVKPVSRKKYSARYRKWR